MSARDPPLSTAKFLPSISARPLLIVVEGNNDAEFLTRLSQNLNQQDSKIPNLATLLAEQRIVFLPIGGGSPTMWSARLDPLNCREFHLYDREQSPETDSRRLVVARVNSRLGCKAFLTSKRSLENYLHPAAIETAGGGSVIFGNDECVASVVARNWYERVPQNVSWHDLTRRTRHRLAYRAKRWLNTVAVSHMSAELLSERDPYGEVRGWYAAITEMLGDCAG